MDDDMNLATWALVLYRLFHSCPRPIPSPYCINSVLGRSLESPHCSVILFSLSCSDLVFRLCFYIFIYLLGLSHAFPLSILCPGHGTNMQSQSSHLENWTLGLAWQSNSFKNWPLPVHVASLFALSNDPYTLCKDSPHISKCFIPLHCSVCLWYSGGIKKLGNAVTSICPRHDIYNLLSLSVKWEQNSAQEE